MFGKVLNTPLCLQYSEIRVFVELYFPTKGQNGRSCTYMEKYRSVKTGIFTFLCNISDIF